MGRWREEEEMVKIYGGKERQREERGDIKTDTGKTQINRYRTQTHRQTDTPLRGPHVEEVTS